MLDDKSLIDSGKGKLYDQLLGSIEERFDLTDEALVFPEELLPYSKGLKRISSEEERQRFDEVFDEWQSKAFDSLRRRPTVERLSKFLLAMPEPLRIAVCAAVGKKIGPPQYLAEPLQDRRRTGY